MHGTLAIIGQEGIDKIDRTIKERIEWKKKLYGENSELVGFHSHVAFYNKKIHSIIICQELDDPKRTHLGSIWECIKANPDYLDFFPMKHLLVPGNYTIRINEEPYEIIKYLKK